MAMRSVSLLHLKQLVKTKKNLHKFDSETSLKQVNHFSHVVHQHVRLWNVENFELNVLEKQVMPEGCGDHSSSQIRAKLPSKSHLPFSKRKVQFLQ